MLQKSDATIMQRYLHDPTLAILIKHRFVTGGRTDRQTQGYALS